MAQQTLNIGATANDGTGDPLRTAMDKVNDNFDEIYASPLFTEDITISGNEIRANRSNDDLVLAPSGTGAILMPAIRINDNNIEATRTNDDINLVPAGSGSVRLNQVQVRDNTIETFSSNQDLILNASGTGQVTVNGLLVDYNIQINDNEIQTTQSDSDLVISPSGTGQVVISKADIDSGAIDNTVIGGATPLAGTLTTVTATTSATIDGITLRDNQIFTNQSDADLELSASGTGSVRIGNVRFPTADGTVGQVLKTDGNNQLGFATASAQLDHSDINDNTTTVASSATSVIDSFSTATYRSARYFISISDATNDRFEIVEASIVHGPSADSTTEAYITVFGSTTNYGTPLATFTVDVNDGDVRLLATNITSDSTVFKFQRILIDL